MNPIPPDTGGVPLRKQLKQHKRVISLLAIGAIAGTILVTPVGAHVGGSINHLWGGQGHIKSKVVKLGDGRYMRYGRGASLAPGKSMTGAIAFRNEVAGALNLTAVSFPVPLKFTPNVVLVPMGNPTPPTGCPGSASNPRANPGFACIYTGWTTDSDGNWDGFWDAATGGSCGCKHGITVWNVGDNVGDEYSAVWAVTAPTASTTPPAANTTYRKSQVTGKR